MKLGLAFALLACRVFAAPDAETDTVRIEKLDIGNIHRGQNKFAAVVVNKTESLVTVILDLRADPGLWLRKNQRQFVYLLYGKEERHIEAEYRFEHISPEAFLTVRFYFPSVDPTGITRLSKPFLEHRFTVDANNKDVDYGLSEFRNHKSKHFLIYYFPDSLAARDVYKIAEERDHGFEKICSLLRLPSNEQIRLFLFPDEDSKKSETGHQGAGWAFGNNIVEVYNEKVKLDPFHEAAHILSRQIGSPAAMFNEGFAVYVSELLGADALRELGSPGKTCNQTVTERRSQGDFIPLRRLLSFTEIGSDSSQPSTSYPEACSIVRFLVDRFGLEKFREAFASVRSGEVGKLEELYGRSIDEIEVAWLSGFANPQ